MPEDISIEDMSLVGNYALQFRWSDGHDTGIYSWETLYNLGKHYDDLWAQYLEELKEHGYTRKEPAA